MNHSMRLPMFSEFSKLKMLAIADTSFAYDIVMLKRFRFIKQSLLRMVISDEWSAYRNDNIQQVQLVKNKLVDDLRWDQVDYILAFTEHIYSMIRMTDTEKPCLHLIYEMWNNMTEKVKAAIYRHEGKGLEESSMFHSVFHGILVDWWGKSKTPLHCLVHALNPRYYSDSWIDEAANRLPPHSDAEIYEVRNSCLRKLFPVADDLRTIKVKYAEFALLGIRYFSLDSIADRAVLDPKTWWWVTHGTKAPELQSLALNVLSQPASSSCCERNWSTYGMIRDFMKGNAVPNGLMIL